MKRILMCVLLGGCAGSIPDSGTYQSKEEYEAVCDSGRTYHLTHTRTQSIHHSRTAESGDVPVVGGTCPGGTWTSVKVIILQ